MSFTSHSCFLYVNAFYIYTFWKILHVDDILDVALENLTL